MIDTTVTTNKGVEAAEKNLQQAKNRLATEKKKANEERRKIENRHKYMMGGVVHKYFPECFSFEEDEMNEILKAALATQECKKVINDIKFRATHPQSKNAESEVSE
jgi:hypothetical protein